MDVALPPREDEDEGDNYSYEYSDARSEESSEELDCYLDGAANGAGPAPPIVAASNGDRAAGIVAASGGLPQVSAGQASGMIVTDAISTHLPCLMRVIGRIRGQGGGGPMHGGQGSKPPRGRDTSTHTRAQSIMHG